MSENQETQARIDEFLKRYRELCSEFGLRIASAPKLVQDKDGLFRIDVQYRLTDFTVQKEGETE